MSQLFSSGFKSDPSVPHCLHTICFIKETLFLIGSSLHVLEDLKQHQISLYLVKFPFHRKDLPQLQQVLFPCNAVNALEQLCVAKLSFLTKKSYVIMLSLLLHIVNIVSRGEWLCKPANFKEGNNSFVSDVEPAHIVNKREDKVYGLTIFGNDLDAILDMSWKRTNFYQRNFQRQ